MDEVPATLFSYRYHAHAARSDLGSVSDVRTYGLRLVTMLTTLSTALAQGSRRSAIPAPEQFMFLTPSISWQSVSNSDAQLLLPTATSDDELGAIAVFSNEVLRLLEQIDQLAWDVENRPSSDHGQNRKNVEELVERVDAIIQLFAGKFQCEMQMIESVVRI